MDTQDNTILISGGAAGIGLALARHLLERDNQVIICGRNSERLAAAQARVPGLHVRCCDITDKEQIDELVAWITREHAKLNMLINNAGIQCHPDFSDGKDHSAVIEHEIATNLTSHILLTDRLLPQLRRQTQSAIINITSALAVVPKRSAPIYCATKAGMRAFSRALRYQLEQTSISVFDVMPPLVNTAMTQDRPQRGKISPDYVARAVLKGLAKGRYEIPVAKAKLLMLIHRCWPAMAYRILKNE